VQESSTLPLVSDSCSQIQMPCQFSLSVRKSTSVGGLWNCHCPLQQVYRTCSINDCF
jgi:hypothetical protein